MAFESLTDRLQATMKNLKRKRKNYGSGYKRNDA